LTTGKRQSIERSTLGGEGADGEKTRSQKGKVRISEGCHVNLAWETRQKKRGFSKERNGVVKDEGEKGVGGCVGWVGHKKKKGAPPFFYVQPLAGNQSEKEGVTKRRDRKDLYLPGVTQQKGKRKA